MADIRISSAFPRCERFDPQVPVWCVTPNEGRCIHRFFDTSPFSPSGRYLAVFRMPFEDRLPESGDAGQIVLVDLQAGGERVVAETRGWEPQMGANVNWGASDDVLLFNDVDTQTWTPYLVKLNPLTGNRERIEGGVYRVSPDGRTALAANLACMRRTQIGYGVMLPDDRVPLHTGAPDDDGLFATDVETGERRMVLSLASAAQHIPELRDGNVDDWRVYGFHCKHNPQGDRILFTVRRHPASLGPIFNAMGVSFGQLRYDVLTLRPDGTDVHDAVPADQWEKGGHHVNWCPDGEHLSMNLNIDRDGMRFVRCRYDGAGLAKLFDDPPGSGHPTVHPDGRHILTDDYAFDGGPWGDYTVPLRWVDVRKRTERTLVRIGARTEPMPDSALRVDPHPAWESGWRWIVFNGVGEDNTRRVFVADMQKVLG